MGEKKMSDGRRLRLARGLYGMVKPGFPCKQGCFSCCKTVVQMLRVEWEHLQTLPVFKEMEANTEKGPKKIVEINKPGLPELVQIVDDRGWCPFVDDKTGACRVYADRPVTCRVYGQHFIMPCEEGVDAPVEIEVEGHVLDKWARLAGEDGTPPGGSIGIGRKPDEARAVYVALTEWRERVGDRCALPSVEEQPAIHKRAEEILGRKIK